MKNLIFIVLFLSYSFSQKEYVKNYYPNKNMKEEGWMMNDKKTDYWFYYYEDGFKKKEGHYKNNQKTSWWIYYDCHGIVAKKCEYNKNELNGLTLVFDKGEIMKAEKYANGKKIKTWTDINEFKKDNFFLNYQK